ncbi:extracellular solute-binding protein [Spelaeicoccus albus]|uniref:Multiple sugar transport system substrate-binding protein n=1 Tax=Spelaeicoccus albus TaxID=1280376 RepID=A0A7Z0IJ70_9MICO|nr:extracellular solute-binding protein [Spelaeicoccus albus]NYI69213.1 multiple sugar transport system substrate-binding protein [Spelaeicoccus albus]
MKSLKIAAALVSAVALIASSGCSGSGSDDNTVKVAYEKFGNFQAADTLMKRVKKEMKKTHPDATIKLVPIQAKENDYYTKLALMERSPSTAPDVIYEDTFQIKSDVAAGHLLALDKYLKGWKGWNQFVTKSKQAGLGVDGKTYGVPMGTDTRVLWYNKKLLKKAGVSVPWQPKNWHDILATAKKVQTAEPKVMGLNVFSGKSAGEASTMQGFEMLLYGTGDTLYKDKKWVLGSQGFKDSLKFIQTLYKKHLGPSAKQSLDTQIQNTVPGSWMPKGKIAISLDGSWLPSTWIKGGAAEWPAWDKTLGTALMPTQNGQGPGFTSMSGGWTLSVGKDTKAPKLAFDVIKTALNEKNSTKFDIGNSQIAVRKDVASDPKYTKSDSSFGKTSKAVQYTHYRPATEDYPKISNKIQVAMEAVMTGQQTPAQAAAAYDKAVIEIVGKKHTTTGK